MNQNSTFKSLMVLALPATFLLTLLPSPNLFAQEEAASSTIEERLAALEAAVIENSATVNDVHHLIDKNAIAIAGLGTRIDDLVTSSGRMLNLIAILLGALLVSILGLVGVVLHVTPKGAKRATAGE